MELLIGPAEVHNYFVDGDLHSPQRKQLENISPIFLKFFRTKMENGGPPIEAKPLVY